MKYLMLLITLCLAVAGELYGQKPKPLTAEKQAVRGTITGKVTDESGAPLEDAEIYWVSVGGTYYSAETGSTVSDRNGKFRAENLKPRRYTVSARVTGYVSSANEIYQPENINTYQLGADVSINMQKGGAMTGKVFDAGGEPLVRVAVRAIRVRDASGQKIPAQEIISFSQQNYTDDRGIYRIFGLNSGVYLVYVGGNFRYETTTAATGNVAVYHQAASLATANEVFVQVGQETNGIDIQFREDKGFSVSGEIVGLGSLSSRRTPTVALYEVATAQNIAYDDVSERNGKYAFKFEQIPAGIYEIRAVKWGEKSPDAKSVPQKVEVKDADVSGLQIKLTPLVSVEGKIILEKNPALEKNKECRQTSPNALTETVLKLKREKQNLSVSIIGDNSGFFAAPEENGEFSFNGIEAEKYRLVFDLKDESLFIGGILQSISPKETRDLGREGLNLGAGEKSENIIATVRNGAAQISGKVEVEKSEKDTRQQFRVYLVPFEAEAKNDILRFAETKSDINGIFNFKNLAAGKYFLFAEPDKNTKDELLKPNPPIFWNVEKRAKLRELAEKKNVTAELKPCQNVMNQVFKHEIK